MSRTGFPSPRVLSRALGAATVFVLISALPVAQAGEIKMATTTSTENSGLLNNTCCRSSSRSPASP